MTLKLWRGKVACKVCGAPLDRCECDSERGPEDVYKPKVAVRMAPNSRNVTLACECGWVKVIGSMVYLTNDTLATLTKRELKEHAKTCTAKGHGRGAYEVN